jgi:hypothetical protein
MSEPTHRDPVRTFFGYVLVVVGGLMATLCGLCTLVFFVGGLVTGGSCCSVSAMALAVGVLPTALGLLLFFGGRAQLRVASRPPPGDEPHA